MAKISQINDLKDKLNRSGKIIFRGNETGKILIEDRKLNIILETQDNELLKDLRSNAAGILKVKGERYDHIEIILNNYPYAKISKEGKLVKYFRGKDVGIFIKEMESGFEQGFDCVKNLSDTNVAEFSGKAGPIGEKEIKKLLEIFNEIMNVVPKKANSIGDMYINFIGSDHMAVYYFEHIWTIELLIKILENSSKNRARIIFCLSVLNDLYYFVLDDSDKFSKDEYWSEFRKVKKLLYPYSDKFYDGLLEKNIGNCC